MLKKTNMNFKSSWNVLCKLSSSLQLIVIVEVHGSLLQSHIFMVVKCNLCRSIIYHIQIENTVEPRLTPF